MSVPVARKQVTLQSTFEQESVINRKYCGTVVAEKFEINNVKRRVRIKEKLSSYLECTN
jgi:hypothetical protein